MSGNELETIVEGLEANYLLNYDYLLTGYIGFEFIFSLFILKKMIGSKSFLSSILQVLDKITSFNSNVRFEFF